MHHSRLQMLQLNEISNAINEINIFAYIYLWKVYDVADLFHNIIGATVPVLLHSLIAAL